MPVSSGSRCLATYKESTKGAAIASAGNMHLRSTTDREARTLSAQSACIPELRTARMAAETQGRQSCMHDRLKLAARLRQNDNGAPRWGWKIIACACMQNGKGKWGVFIPQAQIKCMRDRLASNRRVLHLQQRTTIIFKRLSSLTNADTICGI
jgi:hypothetical protein